MRPEWICSQGVYFEPKAGGEVGIFGIYTNKQKSEQTFSTKFLSKLG